MQILPEIVMRTILLSCLLLIFFQVRVAASGEVREIELIDGTTITGEVQSLQAGVYTIKSDSLGIIKIEDSKVRAIRPKSAVPAGKPGSGKAATEGGVKDLQQKMMSDKEIMGLIESLQNDPDFKKILEDPEIMKAVQEGNIPALTADPRIMQLLNNPTVREIEKKVK